LPLHRAAAVAVASASVYVVIPSAARDLLQTQWNVPSLLLSHSPSYLHSHLHFRAPHPSSLRKGGRRCCCLFLVSVSAVVPPALTEEGTEAGALFASQRGISPPLFAIAPSGATRPERIATALRSAAQFPQPERWCKPGASAPHLKAARIASLLRRRSRTPLPLPSPRFGFSRHPGRGSRAFREPTRDLSSAVASASVVAVPSARRVSAAP
jgi:hypothetical protein